MRDITRRTALTMAAGTVTASTVFNAATAAADAPAPGRPVASGANPALRTALITRVTPRNNWRVMAVAVRYAHPSTCAAALATAGWGDPSTMDSITHIPIWADHSIDDPVVPYREGREPGAPGRQSCAVHQLHARNDAGEPALRLGTDL